MSGKLIGMIAGGVVLIAVIVAVAASGVGDSEIPSATTAATDSATDQPGTTQTVAATTAPEQVATTAPEAVACTSSQQPHIVAKGVVTAIDGVPMPRQGEVEGIWFAHGNSVSITVPEAGGPAFVSVAAVIATDQGQFQTYSVGHDSRGAYPPPDARTPENYLAFDAGGNALLGSVGVAIDAIEAGGVASTNPSVFTSSGFDATFTGAGFTGTIAHPDLDIVFVADSIDRLDRPVFSSPACYLAAVEAARESDNPAP